MSQPAHSTQDDEDLLRIGDVEYLTTEEVAAMCRTRPTTVKYWRHIGYGPPGAKVGKRILYRRSDVQAWLESRFDAPGTERTERNL